MSHAWKAVETLEALQSKVDADDRLRPGIEEATIHALAAHLGSRTDAVRIFNRSKVTGFTLAQCIAEEAFGTGFVAAAAGSGSSPLQHRSRWRASGDG